MLLAALRSARLKGVSLLLVRHAHAQARKEWSGDDRLRPLSANGFRQAAGLISIADNFPRVSLLVSSPYLRCLQTMVPLATATGIVTASSDDLAEGQSSAAVKLIRSLAGTSAAVCTHGDVIVEILVTLADEDRVDLGPNPRQAKGSVWVLEGEDGSFASARYFPPVVAERV
jgi:broad specificity phosphatase PhoE